MHIASTWEWPSLGFNFFVSKEVIDQFQRNIPRSGMPERGGQLFVTLSFSIGLIISSASAPHQHDIASQTSLIFDHKRCKMEIEQSNQQRNFLVGYWHTHTENEPQLSKQDLITFQQFSIANCYVLPFPIAVIVGTQSTKVWSMRSVPKPGIIKIANIHI